MKNIAAYIFYTTMIVVVAIFIGTGWVAYYNWPEKPTVAMYPDRDPMKIE